MSEAATPRPDASASHRPGTPGGVLRDLAFAAPVTAVATAPTWWLLGRPASHPVLVGALYLLVSTWIARALPQDAPGPGIGPANRVTLLRGCLVLTVLALALQPAVLGAAACWWIIVVSTIAMSLDGVDGRVARRTGTQTPFGARFDMELDAALIMALAVLVWASGKVGAWVLLIGLMRYAFVAAGWVLPALRGELPESLRRKVVCVVQGVALLVALGPIIPPVLASVASGAALLALTWSFAVDVRWLMRA